MIRRLAIVGFGLLGGSVAKAARQRALVREVVAVGRRREPLLAPLEEGVVDWATTDLVEGLAGADFVVLAGPVGVIEALLPRAWQAAAAGAVITDVGSIKGPIVRRAESLPAGREVAFVGSHPMAGSELSGYASARPDLFTGALVIVTPIDATPLPALKRVTEFWEALGARVHALDPDEHDRAVAAVSHLPHLAAYALVEAVARLDPQFLGVAARGFKDTTRIAASDARVWGEIFLGNRPALGEALGAFRASLADLERLVAEGHGPELERELERIRELRSRLT